MVQKKPYVGLPIPQSTLDQIEIREALHTLFSSYAEEHDSPLPAAMSDIPRTSSGTEIFRPMWRYHPAFNNSRTGYNSNIPYYRERRESRVSCKSVCRTIFILIIISAICFIIYIHFPSKPTTEKAQ